jgi:hypothetical protein
MGKFNILRNADIRNSTGCRYDTNEGFAVSWTEDGNFQEYEEFDGLTTRAVENRNYFSVATSGTCYIGPISDRPAFDGGIYDTVKVTYRVDVGFNQTPPTTGQLQFQTASDPIYDEEKVVQFPIRPDNAYNEYTVDMSQIKDWHGNITRIRLYPFIDGSPGTQIHVQSLRVQSSTTFSCATLYTGGLCSKYSEYSHPCPWVGAGGSSQGELLTSGVTIVEGVSDELTVNINDYGEHTVTLKPGLNVRLEDVARDVEEKLSNIAIGGYAGCKVVAELNRLKIIADDTREAISTVIVSDTPAARNLGFFDDFGTSTAIELSGEDAATRYEPVGTVQLSKTEIAQFYVADQTISESSITLDPRNYAAEAGRPDFSLVTRERDIDFIDKTIIEFNRPVSQTGTFTFFGYAGDATTTTQVVFLRPKADGSLTVIDKVALGATGNLDGRVFELSMSVYLRKGDLVGIEDGRIYTGADAEHPNVSYFLHDGTLSIGDTISIPDIHGLGDEGLFLYARGPDKQTEVVLDIDFNQPELVEEIEVVALEDVREEVVNLTQTLSGGINGGPFITGETGVDKFGNQAPALTDLGALTDGVKANTPDSEVLHPSWLDSPFSPSDLYDQTEMAIILDFAKGVPTFFNIGKVIVHYRDINNVKFFRIDYPLTTNEDDTLYHWGPVSSQFDSIALDGNLLEPNTHPLYTHPIKITVENFDHAYQFTEFNAIEFNFPTVRARSLKFGVKNYYYNDDPNSLELSDYELAPSPNFLEMEVFAINTPVASIADNFTFESSNDGDSYIAHDVIRDTGTTSAKYLIGYPVRNLRARIRPQGRLVVKSLDISASAAPLDIDTNAGDRAVALQLSKEDFTSYETVTVTNTSSETFNYYVSIAPQRNAVERCLLWNKMGTPSQLSKSQIGPAPSFTKREDYLPRETNVSLNAPAYIVDPFWMLNRNVQTYISYDLGVTWEKRGNILADYNYGSIINSKTPLFNELSWVYVLLDLGKVYPLVTVEQIRSGGTNAIKDFSTSILYSSVDVDTPEEVDLDNDFLSGVRDARWIRLRAVPHNPASNNQVPTVSFIRATFDPNDPLMHGDTPWVEAPLLTNYVFGSNTVDDDDCGEGWHCAETAFPDPSHYYAVNLEDHYNITNILTGPQTSDALNLTNDIDLLEPGGAASAYPSSGARTNSNIAYGVANTDDPKNVQWGAYGDPPSSKTRWILRRSPGWLTDEITVHVDDNVNEDKTLFMSARWWTALLGNVEKDQTITHNGTHSMSVTYSANQGPAVEEIEVLQTFGIDGELAKKDTFRILLYVSDVDQLDLTQGHIALGRNTTEKNGTSKPLQDTEPDRVNYFQWDFSDMASLITSGWNELHLPFSDNFRQGQPFLTRDDYLSLSPTSPNGRSRLRWFRVNFVGKENNSEFSVKVGDIRMVRGDFVPAKFGNGYYLAGSDYAKFPLNNFNVKQGTIEFYLNADWTKTPGCNTCDDPKDHTIFRFFNSDDFMLGLFMTGEGMRLIAIDGDLTFMLSDNNSPIPIRADVNTHVAVTWDLLGEKSERGLAIYVDGQLSSAMSSEVTQQGNWLANAMTTLMLGGRGWDGIVSPLSSSVDGTIDNLKVFNYAKSDFTHSIQNEGLEHIRSSDELIEISLDGVNFYGNESIGDGLPLLFQTVGPGEKFNVYIRNKAQEGVTAVDGQERTSYLEVVKARPG